MKLVLLNSFSFGPSLHHPYSLPTTLDKLWQTLWQTMINLKSTYWLLTFETVSTESHSLVMYTTSRLVIFAIPVFTFLYKARTAENQKEASYCCSGYRSRATSRYRSMKLRDPQLLPSILSLSRTPHSSGCQKKTITLSDWNQEHQKAEQRNYLIIELVVNRSNTITEFIAVMLYCYLKERKFINKICENTV